MIITNKPVQNISKAYTDASKVSSGTKTVTGSGQRQDELILSPQAQEIRQAIADIKELPEIRQDKVEAIASQIADGSYNVEARDVSEAIWAYFKGK